MQVFDLQVKPDWIAWETCCFGWFGTYIAESIAQVSKANQDRQGQGSVKFQNPNPFEKKKNNNNK